MTFVSLEHLIREKLEAHFTQDPFAKDMAWLLREWKAEVKAAGDDYTLLLGSRSYWDAYV